MAPSTLVETDPQMADQPALQRIVVPFNGRMIGEGFNSDTVVTALHFRARDVEGVAATRPGDPAGAMSGPDVAGWFLDDTFTSFDGLGGLFTQVGVGRTPTVFLEIQGG